jgi:hypothetical protein
MMTICVERSPSVHSGFKAQQNAGNPTYNIATKVLENDFSEINAAGPIRPAEFLGHNGASRDQIRQDLVTVARRLLGT